MNAQFPTYTTLPQHKRKKEKKKMVLENADACRLNISTEISEETDKKFNDSQPTINL